MEGFYEASTRVQEHDHYETIAQEILWEKRDLGICCFSDTRNSELMWVHYASDYKGICVGYDPQRLIEALPDGSHLIRLAYGSRPPRIGIHDVDQPGRAAIRILSHKKDCWSYEREWRVLGGPGQVPISEGCIREINFGARVAPNHRDQIEKQVRPMGIAVSRMTVNQYSHKFE
jgi:hypothetical protein